MYKFFAFQAETGAHRPLADLVSPRAFGSIMIVTGIVSLVIATLQHRLQLNQIKAEFGPGPLSPAMLLAGLISLLGLLALVPVLLGRGTCSTISAVPGTRDRSRRNMPGWTKVQCRRGISHSSVVFRLKGLVQGSNPRSGRRSAGSRPTRSL